MTALGKLLRTTVFKLSLAFMVMFAIGAGLVLGRVGYNVETLVDEQISDTIDAEITGLAEQYAQGGIRRLVDAVERRSRQPGSSLYLVTTNAGETIAGNVAELPRGVLDHPGLAETTYQRVGEQVPGHSALARIFVLPGGFRLLVGRDLEERETLRRVIVRTHLTSLIWLTIIGTGCGIIVALRVLRRVDAMNASARTIMAGDLSGRLPRAGSGDELDRLAESLNNMLERIGELMKGMKEVSDNIAHDLKTPLTRLRNGAEQALRSAKSTEDYRAALETVLDESDGLIRIFNALLMIARLEAGTEFEEPVDFDAAAVARDVAELYEPLAEDEGTSIALDVTDGQMIHGHRELIGQALSNLVDNALKYGRQQTPSSGSAPEPVRIAVRRTGDQIELEVSDRGPGIAIADRGRVLDRFVRLEGSRSRPGTGLGLSLATAVAHLHKGELRIEDNAPGLRVLITIPASRGVVAALVPPPRQLTYAP